MSAHQPARFYLPPERRRFLKAFALASAGFTVPGYLADPLIAAKKPELHFLAGERHCGQNAKLIPADAAGNRFGCPSTWLKPLAGSVIMALADSNERGAAVAGRLSLFARGPGQRSVEGSWIWTQECLRLN